MAFANIDFTIDGDIGVMTLKRPEVLNALDIAMAREIRALSEDLRFRPTVKALIMTGAGRAFSAGGDLGSVRLGQDGMKSRSLDITGVLHAAVSNFMRMDLPVIAAVNGVAAGAGFALACAADIIVAAASAKFMASYTLAGLSPDLGLTYTLPRLVGMGRAKSIILTNRMVLPDEAEKIGLISQIVADDALMATAKKICADILRGTTAAIGVTKRLLAEGCATGLEPQLQAESEELATLSATDESFARCLRFAK